jgi:hypothetical protein
MAPGLPAAVSTVSVPLCQKYFYKHSLDSVQVYSLGTYATIMVNVSTTVLW